MMYNEVPGRFVSEEGVAATEERKCVLQNSAEQSLVFFLFWQLGVSQRSVSRRDCKTPSARTVLMEKGEVSMEAEAFYTQRYAFKRLQITSSSLVPVTRAQDSAV